MKNYKRNLYGYHDQSSEYNIMDIDLSGYAESAMKAHGMGLEYTPDLGKNFIDHTIPILASIPLKMKDGLINSESTIKSLPEYISTPNGKYRHPKALLQLLYYVKRANLITGSQVKNSRLASFTPMLMYAHKLHNGVSYSKWDRNDKFIRFILGKYLENILTVTKIPEDIDYAYWRTLALTVSSKGSKTYGQMARATSYKCNLHSIMDVELPKTVIMQVLQLWLANVECRNTESMILDPLNWDNIPEPIDAVVPEIVDDDVWI